MTKELNLRQRLRASHVKRWHIVETLRPQTVAEHTFNVMVTAEEIVKVLNMNETIRNEVMQYALVHDIAEVVTGDIPTPVKQVLNSELCVVESHAIPLPEVRNTSKDIVKLADLLESIVFITMYGIGKHAQDVRQYLLYHTHRHLYDRFHPIDIEKLNPVTAMIHWNTEQDKENTLWEYPKL